MVPKSGGKLPFSPLTLSEAEFAGYIGAALQRELGASRGAAKTVMRWTHVSNHTARSWLHGQTSPSGLHLVELAAQSTPVMHALLQLTGRGDLLLRLELDLLEQSLERTLQELRAFRHGDRDLRPG